MKYLVSFIYMLVICVTVKGTTNPCQIAQVCVTDLSQANCYGDEELVPNSHIFGCCPSCQLPAATTPGGKWSISN